VLAFVLRRRVAFRWLAVGLGALIVAVVVHRFMLAGDGWSRVYYAPDTRSDGILLGCLLAVVWKMRLLCPGRAWSFVGPSALLIYAVDVASLRHTSPHIALYGITVANIAAAAMIGSVIMARGAPFSQLLSLAPLRRLGVISYGLYIWLPITALVTGAHGTVMLILGLAIAALSYRFIERPFRRPPSERAEAEDGRGGQR